MTGICGVLLHAGTNAAALPRHVQTMAARLRDGQGSPSLPWYDQNVGVALAQRVRMGDDAAPRVSGCGRYVLCMEGGLHTRAVLQRACSPMVGADADDAALVLASIVGRGVQRTLRDCDGAFAFGLWDRLDKVLWLARDRVGERPLYYGWIGGDLLFGSHLAGLHAYPRFRAPVDPDALALLLRYGYIPAPHSIHEGIFKVMAGCMVRIDPATHDAGAQAHVAQAGGRRYWDAREEMRSAIDERGQFPLIVSDAEARLEMLLHQSVSRRMSCDRPVAAFLSGGTDSSLVTAVMQAQCEQPIDTFTVGFDDPGHDEADWADRVARHLGTRHTRRILRRSDAAALVSALPDIWCEPFADASQVPTLLATLLVSGTHATVMTGDGGDELFYGHGSYSRAVRNAAWVGRVPSPVRSLLRRWAPTGERARLGGWPAVRSELCADGLEAHYLLRVSRWRDPAKVVLGATEPLTAFTDRERWLDAGDPADRVQYLDFLMDLGNGLLTKIDRAGGAHGVVTRSPLLDATVVRFAWSLPSALKFADGQHKWLLKQLLSRHLPSELVHRPKMGFGPPMASWLAGPLFGWADALLDETRLQREGYFDASAVRHIWDEFCGGRRKWHTHLWPILMFQAWLERHHAAVADPAGS